MTDQQNVTLHLDRWASAMAEDCSAAKKSIDICSMSMQPPRRNHPSDWQYLWFEWVRAHQRGVRVRMWLAAPQATAAATKGNAGAGKCAVAAGLSICYVRGQHLLHSKALVVDASTAWVGSGNFTLAATSENFESYLRVTDDAISDRLIKHMESWL